MRAVTSALSREVCMIRLFGYLFSALSVLALAGAAVVAVGIHFVEPNLPDYTVLADYVPPVKSRLYASNGETIAEFAKEQRIFIPIQDVPDRVKAAFISAEDKNFYEHSGLDFTGLARAIIVDLSHMGSGRRLVGASTITQQVAKNLLLTSDQTMTRKVKEALLSLKIESTLSKDRILELYLNQIFLGERSYGLAQAALTYFNKSVADLTIAETAYLAALPKGPANYNPYTHADAAVDRRNWVIDRMVENGYVTAADGEAAKKEPLGVVEKENKPDDADSGYFFDEVRRTVVDQVGEKALYQGGLAIRTTYDPDLQEAATKALQDALVSYDQRQGYRGPLQHLDSLDKWTAQISNIDPDLDVTGWDIAVVLRADASEIDIGPRALKGSQARLDMNDLKWALGRKKAGDLLHAGDVIVVEDEGKGMYRLRQIPKIQGALVSMQPRTGRIVAMVGGFSHALSQFNRATQAKRQPGSVFKPVVYAAALDSGYTPSTVIQDEPVDFHLGDQTWSPKNDSDEYAGPATFRFGLEHSRNVMAAKLADTVGIDTVTSYAQRLGIYGKDIRPVLSMSIGSAETTVLNMVSAYAAIDNGGMQVVPTLIDRIQDRLGKTIYRHEQVTCNNCNATSYTGQDEPELVDARERVLDPMTTYQVTSMMESVVSGGTAAGRVELGRPVAGKTGTTNENHDAWFVGFTPDLVTGIYIGYDQPESLGRAGTGGGLAAPVFNTFMKHALANTPPTPFVMPDGMTEYVIDNRTGMIAADGDPNAVKEAFKPGTHPPVTLVTLDDNGFPDVISSDVRKAISSGAVGLY